MSTINFSKAVAAVAMGTALAVPTMLPTTAVAAPNPPQSHRQKEKNNWRNLGIAGGVLGAAGLVTHNKALAIGGLAGGAYSAYRYEQARKDQSRARSHWRRHRYTHHTYRHHH